MNNHQVMNTDWSHLADLAHQRARRPSLRRRIERRARTLSLLDRDRYFRAMVSDLCRGKLDHGLVEFWSPDSGGVGLPQRKET